MSEGVIVSRADAGRSLTRRDQAVLRLAMGHITESTPRRLTARRMKGMTVVGRSELPASPQFATHPP